MFYSMYMGMCVYAYTHIHGLIDELKIGKGEKAHLHRELWL